LRLNNEYLLNDALYKQSNIGKYKEYIVSTLHELWSTNGLKLDLSF